MDAPDPASRSRFRPANVLVVLAAVLVVALLTFGLVANSSSTTIDDGLARGEPVPAPDFELDVLDPGNLPPKLRDPVGAATADGRLSLDELRGTPVVLNFWASWCFPCREEAPALEQGWERDGKKGVVYLGLDMQDSSGDALEFIEEFSLSYPTVREPSNQVARSFGATGIPETFFITAQGEVVMHVRGAVSPEQLQDGVAAALSAKAQPPAPGGDFRQQR